MHTLKTLLIALVMLIAPLPVGGYEAWLLPLITAFAGIALLIELAHPRERATSDAKTTGGNGIKPSGNDC